MSKKWIAVIALYLGLLAACIVVLYAVPSVRGMLEKTYIAEFGTLDVKDEVSAFVVRDEQVYVAAQSSGLERRIEEGELTKAAAVVVYLNSKEGNDSTAEDGSYDDIVNNLGKSVKETKDGSTADAGYVSYSVDGAEAELTTARLEELTKADYESLTGRKAKETPKRGCKKGEPVFKIIKNHKWYMVFYTDKENAARYREGSYASMDVNGEPIRLRVYRVEEVNDAARVILECKSFFDGFLESRTINATLTLASAEGLILQKSSLVEHDGKQGVFVKNKLGEHKFKPVLIVASDKDMCVAYSDLYLDAEGNFVETIGTYDEIIAEPSEEDMASLKPKADNNKEEKNDDAQEENKDSKDNGN